MKGTTLENIIIRQETESDFRTVEELMKKTFWNLYKPGGDEHYLVHTMRNHADFVRDLDLILIIDEITVASIMYVKSKLIDEYGNEKTVLTFGPLGVLPAYQRKGYGKILQNYSFEKAISMGYDTVVIYGNPENYISSNFKSCKKYNVSTAANEYPVALLVRELKEGVLNGNKWVYKESSAYDLDPEAAENFDKDFEPMKKCYQPSQELFYIYSRGKIM